MQQRNRMIIMLRKTKKMLLIYHLISPLIRAITIMNSVRAKLCGGVWSRDFRKKVREGSFLKLLVAKRPCKITHLINNVTIIYNKFSKTSMHIFISPKISKSIFVEEEQQQEEGDLRII